jgi:hypothetical protein
MGIKEDKLTDVPQIHFLARRSRIRTVQQQEESFGSYCPVAEERSPEGPDCMADRIGPVMQN